MKPEGAGRNLEAESEVLCVVYGTYSHIFFCQIMNLLGANEVYKTTSNVTDYLS